MPRYKATYDGKGKATEWVDGECVWMREDLLGQFPTRSGMAPAVLGDIPDFVSVIDGTVVRGRAGLRDHCARHGVVPTVELKGLPNKPFNMEYNLPKHEREATKRTMHQIIDQRYHNTIKG